MQYCLKQSTISNEDDSVIYEQNANYESIK